jgi:hypothetical protein
VVVETTYTIICSKPSDHGFKFENKITIDYEHIVDPDDSNNHSKYYHEQPVWGDADIEIKSFQVESPPTSIPLNSSVKLTLQKLIHNKGPYGPVDIEVTLTAKAPTGCTVSPTTKTITLTGCEGEQHQGAPGDRDHPLHQGAGSTPSSSPIPSRSRQQISMSKTAS